MYFKALELRGFKSFPERTLLSFDKPLTAIVGPNGSGKSNIADAIQWVMGEQSTKALRGGKMEDVIFGGTEKRGQVGFAEVSLTLDNRDRRLAGDLDEVQVTRRYYRSGESEYYINRKPVRLKDINELFMDTGLGRDGYSIIGQGKIDSILSARSTDRREIFEEAAGISRFRYRKEESERKLQRAEDDLLRVNDKISELELQVEPLRKQSETAKRFLILRDELRGLEISLWLTDLEAIALRVKALKEDALISAGEVERAKEGIRKLFEAGEQFSQRMRDKDLEAESVRERVSETEAKISEEDSAAAVIRANISHTLENIDRIKSEIARREGQSSGLAGQIEERKTRLTEIDAERAGIDTELTGLQEAETSLFRGLDEMDKKAAELTEKTDSAAAELADLRVALSSLAASKTELEERLAAIGRETEEQNEKLESASSEAAENASALREARDAAEGLKNVRKGYELRTDNLRRRFEASRDARAKAEMELNAVSSRRQMLSDMEREYEGYSKAVKTVMRESARGTLRGIHGPAGELVRTQSRFALAVETALGAAVQNIIVSTENDGKSAINLLKRTDSGRVTLLPMNVIRGTRLNERGLEDEEGFEGLAIDLVTYDRQYADIYMNLLGRTAVADTLDSAVRIARRFNHRFRVVTLDGQVVNAGGSMTGGSVSRNTGILSRASELESLAAKEKELTEALDQAKSRQAELKRSLDGAEYELNVCGDELREKEDHVLKLQGAKERFDLLLTSLEDRLDQLETEQRSVKKRLTQTGADSGGLAEKAAVLEKRAAELRDQLDKCSGGREELIARRRELTESQSALRERRASLDAEYASGEQSIAELTRLREELTGDGESQERALADMESRCAALREEISGHEANAQALRDQVKKLRDKISAIAEDKLKIEAERSKSDRLLQEKNNALLELERQASRVESRIEASQMEEKQIIDRLWDGYELTRSAAMEQRLELPNIQAAKRRTGELKRAISALGTPNLGAIEEFERVNTRYTYLTEQRDDIDKSRRELLSMIADITGSMEKIFVEELERINQGFQETFLELFGGGRASVSLEDPEDVLGCGIDIKVQPPGKSLKTITLLSGGEKAFVAIALYFAILKVRPTPFVVMDEIEAALDDANVVRVAQYMRKLADKTQFLTITHRRGTMEEADVLYGVTMQEQGVSKVLCIDLDEAEKAIGK